MRSRSSAGTPSIAAAESRASGRPRASTTTGTPCAAWGSTSASTVRSEIARAGRMTRAGSSRASTPSDWPAEMAAVAPCQRKAQMSTVHTTRKRSGRAPESSGRPIAHTTTTTTTARPHQPATTRPRGRLPVSRHTAASTSCPPSSGRPGRRLKAARRTLTKANAPSRPEGTPSGAKGWTPQASRPRTRLLSGPTTAMAAALPGVPREGSYVVCPPQMSATTAWTRCPTLRATTAWAASWTRTATSRPTA